MVGAYKTYYRWSKAKVKAKEKDKWLRIRGIMVRLQLGGQVCLVPLQHTRPNTRTRPSAATRTRAEATPSATHLKDPMAADFADFEALVAAFEALV